MNNKRSLPIIAINYKDEIHAQNFIDNYSISLCNEIFLKIR
jgi:hypothetical protein